MSLPKSHISIDALIDAQLKHIFETERQLWAVEPDERLLQQYHTAFQQLEQLAAARGDDQRHEFVIVIPVADRPIQLQACLDSLLQLCRSFAYGGFADGRYLKVSAIIADDSKEQCNIDKHKAIAEHCNRQGLSTLYFGLDEQLDLLDGMSDAEKEALTGILGSNNEDAFYHKGSSTMRNIVYLQLNKIKSKNNRILFYFVDSDQTFQINVRTASGDRHLYACNYLFYLDQIFSSSDTCILTGKVVGDPPVSPSVMTGNFLDDVIAFLQQAAAHGPALPCAFHNSGQHGPDDASYHDMAALFGFKPGAAPYDYRCDIRGEHGNAQCFAQFARELRRFFYGEHPTRSTCYQHEDLRASVKAARTVYTGNYIIKPAALKYFIPFAPLKLRMPGPVLGRLLKTEIGHRFVSANLPMLHKRTLDESGQAEFRPGIAEDLEHIDLAGEFERQFYGDVMLFSIEKLCASGYPAQAADSAQIAQTVEEMHQSMLRQYTEKRSAILSKLGALHATLSDPGQWWNQSAEHREAVKHFGAFIGNIEHNFGERSAGYARIHSPANKARRHAEIIAGIAAYAQDKLTWAAMLSR